MSFSPIAIVGRSVILPGANSPEALWTLAAEGRDVVQSAPAGRWRVGENDALCSPNENADNKAWSNKGGYVNGFESLWNPEGFAVAATTLNELDPLFQWALHCARTALADAGDARQGAVDRSRVGAIFGNLGYPSTTMTQYAEAVWQGQPAPNPINRFMSGGAANILEQALGLAPGVACLDTACASSLYAIKLACDKLHDGSVDMMLAGAVNGADDLFVHVGFTALNAMSKTGQSRPFHAEADGLVPAEGAGMVALKRLADARRDGDHIYGVIRGVGLSNDGRGRGFLAPLVSGQERAISAAYTMSGVSPSDVSLLECHATGTTVGDATEIKSTAAVYAGLKNVPMGSLKSNMGHLITTAGVAGLVKTLEALRHQQRAPTLHIEKVNPEIAGSPFRLLNSLEAWPSEGIRTAGISAFGFGGNNAHLIVSEEHPSIVAQESAVQPPATLAIVGVGAIVGDAHDRDAFAAQLHTDNATPTQITDFEMSLKGLKFPPKDLHHTLPQQLLLLKAARQAMTGVAPCASEKGGVFVAMEPDVEVCRYGLRWRLPQTMREHGLDPDSHREALEPLLEGIKATLNAAGVVGHMPNIPANRLNSQFDLGAGSVSFSAGEGTGLLTLTEAQRALRCGEVDLALVGGVDLCCQSVHATALAQMEGSVTPAGDAAVAIVVKRLSDAEAAGDAIIATISDANGGNIASSRDAQLGRCWAAGDLRDLVAETLLLSEQNPTITVGPFSLNYRAALPALPAASGPTLRFAAHPNPVALPALPTKTPTQSRETAMQTMSPAPSLVPVTAPVAVVTTAQAPAAAPAALAAPVAVAPVAATPVAAQVVGPSGDPVADAIRGQLVALGNAHNAHIAQAASAHDRFMESQRVAMAMLTGAPQQGSAVQLAPPVIAAPAAVPAPAPVPVAKPAPTPVAAPAPAVVAKPKAVVTPKVVAKKAAEPVAETTTELRAPIGPTWDRAQLEIHASGRIADIFGEDFAAQESYRRQVRMPTPPLLLADRITGIDAVPHSMGKGTIWSETDVSADGWYIHQGHMPAGVMIESGQADLMLISYLGVDATNADGRVYRLLGCELTYQSGLPKVGDTLKYDIHMDGHATQGPVRLMFFHYDCRVDGDIVLSVRKGQAGFFTDEELADSDGCLWTPEEQAKELAPNPRLDGPFIEPNRADFSYDDIMAFADGRPWDCFGAGYERAMPHTRTPRIPNGDQMLLGPITGLDPKGGPWGRGYAKSTFDVKSDTWFFDGHFHNDPCMPGTLMFDGCLQLMSFYLAALGYTVRRDGWRFEPTPDMPFQLSCRGQVTPSSKVLTYELFVEELHDGPNPRLIADMLCTIDGLKGFHARRVSIDLVPGWPLDEFNDDTSCDPLERHPSLGYLSSDYVEPKPVADDGNGFPFDYRSLVACANGRPSEAFGPIYDRFDSQIRVARLPNPPYHFLSRVTRTKGPIGTMEDGMEVDVEFDIDPSAWYFEENGCRAMPFAVLLEAALQPCGWLASYLGCALTTETELCFRNLDGKGTLHVDLLPDHGTMLTKVKSTGISSVASMIIVNFEVECTVDDVLIYELETVFGFFPQSALENQVGLPIGESDSAVYDAPVHNLVQLNAPRKADWDPNRPKLAEPMLLMIDRVTGYDPTGGEAGLGIARAEKDIDPAEWFFKCHFFQDPVQPGSLGIEAMIQLLQWFMLEKNLDEGIENPRFETLGLGVEMAWKYRGQVIPENVLVSSTIEVTEIHHEDNAVLVICDASLWSDGKRIYEAEGLGMRIVSGGTPDGETFVIDPTTDDTWLNDHCPTWTAPALPMMSMVDLLAQGATHAEPVTHLRDVRVTGWLTFDGPRTLRTERDGQNVRLVDLTDGCVEVASARITTGDYPRRPAKFAPLTGDLADCPYESGALFHGPAFQLMTGLVQTPQGASSVLNAVNSVPTGRLNPGLLDAATHGIPHDQLSQWFAGIASDKVAYPAMIPEMTFYGPTPTSGTVQCEVRPDGHLGSPDYPAFLVQLSNERGVWCQFRLVESTFDKGTIGSAAPQDRRAFLKNKSFVSGVRTSSQAKGVTTLTKTALEGIDWLPGTVKAIYGTDDLKEVAKREHIAAAHQVHPSAGLPLHRFDLKTKATKGKVTVTGDGMGAVDISPVSDFWGNWFDRGPWPVEDIYYGLIDQFVGKVVLTDPDAFNAVNGRSLMYLGNHQVGVESLLFSIIASALGGVPTVTLAKAEHRTSWLGQLIAHNFTYPGIKDPGVIAFFDREDKASLPKILGELAAEMTGPGRSVMVHIEGTRSLDCTTPVIKMSGAFLDMAIGVNAPVVPIRFVGALPRETMDARREFPIGMGRQDIYIGKPILPEELAGLHYGERKALVVNAINALGPANEDEVPTLPNPAFAKQVTAWQKKHGVSLEDAVLGVVLNDREEACKETKTALKGKLPKGDLGAWLGELRARVLS